MLTIEQYDAGVREEHGRRFYQTMPPLSADEFAELRADIERNGVTVPVIVDEHDNVIDGHHRTMIARELGIDYPTHVIEGLSEADKITMSIALNVKRRQLSSEQKRAVIAQQLRAAPERSNREHAKAIGVDHKTVQAVRERAEATGEIPQLTHTTGADGRERPAQRPVKVTETVTTETVVDESTGEVLDLHEWQRQQLQNAVDTGGVVKLTGENSVTNPPKPAVLRGDDAERDNAEQESKALGRALMTLMGMTVPAHRQRVITRWWPQGKDAVPPDSRALVEPAAIREIAEALDQFANDLEESK